MWSVYMDEIKANEVGALLRGRMGLIIGPSITKHSGCMDEINQKLAERGDVDRKETFVLTGDAVAEKGVSDADVREWVREAIGAQKKSSLLAHITKNRWCAVLSAALDGHFEDAFRQEADRHATWQPVTVLADLTMPSPPRTVPVYKLLGVLARDNFAVSTVSYLDRRSAWRHAVKGFADLVKGNPVLCLGLGDLTWVLADLIAELIGERSAMPSPLLFLTDDPVCGNSKVLQLLNRRTRVLRVRGTVRDVARCAAAAEKEGFTKAIPFPEDDDAPLAKLRKFDDIATLVNDQIEARIGRSEQHRLRDILFSPSVARWDPFAHELDFRRTLGQQALVTLTTALADASGESEAYLVSGGAVTGKTVLLKRLALDLARAGAVVLWLKPSSYPDGPRLLRDLFKEISETAGTKRAVIVMDDPIGFGSLAPRDVVLAAQAADLRIIFLAGVRSSEWGVWEPDDLVGGLRLMTQVEVPDVLDEAEWAALPDYLVTLGVAADRVAAEKSIAGVQSHSARDTLSMLYWLLPETRAGIGSSIRDEYHRLGDVAGLAKVILGTVNQGTGVLKSAYEMVAVADHYRASIPMEVLVTALGVAYHEWVDATKPDSAAWGLFYCEDSVDGQICYRTRNSIVTRLIVEAINGGTLGRTGELRVLSQMLRACTGRSSPVYREFCVRVLVPHEKLDRLDYDEGLQLYDEAINALPNPDKTLTHHKGLWVKNKGHDALLATRILEQALSTPVFPYAQKGEADSHIHTSIAAAILDGMNEGKEKPDEGKAKILDHLSKARSKDFFNPRAVHVQANLIAHLAAKNEQSGSPDHFAIVNQAVADVDHTLLLLRGQVTRSTQPASDIQMLEQIRDTVMIKTSSLEDLRHEAERVWTEFRSQEGFVLVARKLFGAAQEKNKKYDVAYSYCAGVIEKIEAAGASPSVPLYAVTAQIYYVWRVRRQTYSGTGTIDWDVLRDLCHPVVSSSPLKQDPLYKHIYALSLAHLGKWPESNALYDQLRQVGIPSHVLWVPRDFLLNEKGGVRTVQGVIRTGTQRDYFYAEDLEMDFYLDRKGSWRRAGEIDHGAIQFSFAGPVVVNWDQGEVRGGTSRPGSSSGTRPPPSAK
jgi:hypothetical protein